MYKRQILKHQELTILAESDDAGVFLLMDQDGKNIFVRGHPEYDRYTLHNEYERDKKKGLYIDMPVNYYPDNDDTQKPLLQWRRSEEHTSESSHIQKSRMPSSA